MAKSFSATTTIDRPIEDVILPLALSAATKDDDAFAGRIKQAVESSV